ncbi:16S rRNA (adenine(1518)-N(6)/adenine(1519)-N(6))-dimethyltransferase RsmA [Candidatus Endowatersipora endosymbiont of Watersipora subatra]|uniref:16S rRNA (adenine(1518)-N(6)/adenine(1519)-N(6))- dimethyltransferase RsmA n=1 Tax=Candidatus Endowatersipora endosymbiont of Watersipora subatra TaxID=3077946 RepID=UPI00312CA53F
MSYLDRLPSPRKIIEKYNLTPQKKFSQNFILDLNINMKIARQLGSLNGETVVEVGSGPGSLTRALLSSGAQKVISIERDERFIPVLEEICSASNGRLEYHIGDALKINIDDIVKKITGSVNYKIISNLPYNIATPLLMSWLSGDRWPAGWNAMALLFQKEVAQRITASPRDKSWGRLGVFSSWRTWSKITFDLSPKVFFPSPKVSTSVVVIYPRTSPLLVSKESLILVTKMAFQQRRKTLRQNLKSIGGAALLTEVNINPTARAEELILEQFVALAQAMERFSNNSEIQIEHN